MSRQEIEMCVAGFVVMVILAIIAAIKVRRTAIYSTIALMVLYVLAELLLIGIGRGHIKGFSWFPVIFLFAMANWLVGCVYSLCDEGVQRIPRYNKVGLKEFFTASFFLGEVPVLIIQVGSMLPTLMRMLGIIPS